MRVRPLLIAALIALWPQAAPAQEAGDPAAGEKAFGVCKACHKVGEGAKNGVGPILNGILGRTAGTLDSYGKYSPALAAKGQEGLVWDETTLFDYLKDPNSFVGGKSKMTLKLADEKKRADVIAYLKQFDADGNKAQ